MRPFLLCPTAFSKIPIWHAEVLESSHRLRILLVRLDQWVLQRRLAASRWQNGHAPQPQKYLLSFGRLRMKFCAVERVSKYEARRRGRGSCAIKTCEAEAKDGSRFAAANANGGGCVA